MDRCRVAFGARGQDTVMRHDRRPGELAREVKDHPELAEDVELIRSEANRCAAIMADLSQGGREHPMELYKRFRGREPDPQALLRRAGLV